MVLDMFKKDIPDAENHQIIVENHQIIVENAENASDFEDSFEEYNEMDLHLQLKESDKDNLLLHPVMKTFLNIKWNMYLKTFWINLAIDIFYVVLLTGLGQYFLNLIYCYSCCISTCVWPIESFMTF